MSLMVKALGNAGFSLENKAGRVYIDAFFTGIDEVGTLPYYNGNQAEKAEVILITHAHYDHFNIEETIKAVEKSGAVVVAPKIIIEILKQKLPDEKLVTLEMIERKKPPSEMIVEVGNIQIKGFRTYHGRGHNSYLLEMDGVKVFHDADNERMQHFDLKDFENLDLLMFCPWQGSGASEFIDKVKPKNIMLIHLTEEEIMEHRNKNFLPDLMDPIPNNVIALLPGETVEI